MNRSHDVYAEGATPISPTHVGMNRLALPGYFCARDISPTHVGMNRLDKSEAGGGGITPRTWG